MSEWQNEEGFTNMRDDYSETSTNITALSLEILNKVLLEVIDQGKNASFNNH